MTTVDMVEATKQQVTLHNIPSDVMEHLMEYMYKGETSIPPELLLPTTAACDYLQLLDLRERCLNQANYRSTVAPTNAISWYRLANNLNSDRLRTKCSEILSSSLADVSKGTEFLGLSFAEVSDCISGVQEADADTDDLLEATSNWVSHELRTRNKHILDMLAKINLTKCSIECLDAKMKKHKKLFHVQPAAETKLSLTVLQIASQESGNIRHKRCKRQRKDAMFIVISGQEGFEIPHSDCWHLDENMNCVNFWELPFSFPWHSVCEIPGGFVVCGGTDNDLCAMFMMSSKSWKQLEAMPAPLNGHASIFLAGKIYLLGGCNSWPRSSVLSLELERGGWSQEPDMPISVTDPEVACVDSSIFVFDGWDTQQLLELNTLNRTWSTKAKPLKNSYYGARMILVNGQLFIVGGKKRIFVQYYLSADTWTTGNAPTLKHHLGALVHHDQKVYLIGGTYEDRVEEYDLDTRSWSICDMKLPKKLLNLHAFAV